MRDAIVQFVERNPVVSRTRLLFAAYCLVVFVGRTWEPLVLVGYLAWPTPMLIAFKKFVNPHHLGVWTLVLLGGFPLVALAALAIQRLVGSRELGCATGMALAFTAIAVPLSFVTVAAIFIARVYHWPTGW